MSIVKINFYSRCLDERTEVEIILPEYLLQRKDLHDYKKKYPSSVKFPSVYLLNGYSGDYTDWVTMIPSERYVYETRMALVIPSGRNTWYENIPNGPAMRDFIAEELPAFVEAILPISPEAGHRYIAGLSMGGRGAAMISALYPQKYHACACFSSPLSFEGLYKSPEDSSEDRDRIIASLDLSGIGKRTYVDYFDIVKKQMKNGINIPEMYYFFGNKDPLYQFEYQQFKKKSHELNLPFKFMIIKNQGHDFGTWDPALRTALKWFAAKESETINDG